MVSKVALVLMLLLQNSTGARIDAKGGSLTMNNEQDAMPGEAIQRVIQLLENLIAEMDAEEVEDEKQFAEFSAWCTKQQAATQTSIESLQMKIENLGAALAELYARKEELE